MPSNNSNIHKHRPERVVHGYYPVFGRSGSYDLSNYSANKPGMQIKLLLIIADIIGFPVTAWVFLLNIQAWKENLLWGLIAGFWLFKLIRAIIKLIREDEEKRIELREKKKRYNKDIFS